MQTSREEPVPKGPLAVRWGPWTLEGLRAGSLTTAWLVVENAGSAAWRSHDRRGVHVAYHWLDERGNAVWWDGLRTPLPRPVVPGERVEVAASVRAPIPPARYRLAFDLVDEGRFWFEELGNRPLELAVDVRPRIEARALAVRGADPAALAAQDEPLVPEHDASAIAYLAPGCLPAADWSRRVLDAHEEGYAVVGGSIELYGSWLERRRARAALAPWAPGGGRNPSFQHPLLCPSLVVGVEPNWVADVAGLPALRPPEDEPWIYDGRISITARPRSGRRPG